MALRFETKQHGIHDVPIPTTRAPPEQSRGATMRRAKTLTRPERSVAPVPLINPGPPGAHTDIPSKDQYNGSSAWRIFTKVITFWAPDFLLSSMGGLKDEPVRQAWREKMALCLIIALMCAFTGFATVGFQKVLCPETGTKAKVFTSVGATPGTLSVVGQVYNIAKANSPDGISFPALSKELPGKDVTFLFKRKATDYPECTGINYRIALDDPCAAATTSTQCPLPTLTAAAIKALGFNDTSTLAGYSWDQVANMPNYIVLDGAVLNLTPYFELHPNLIAADAVDVALRALTTSKSVVNGKDGTRLFFNDKALVPTIDCIQSRYFAGNIDKIQPGCFISSIVLYIGLFVILGLVMVRFVMACIFKWFLSGRLAGNVDSSRLNRSAISPAVMPEGANISVDNHNGIAPWSGPAGHKKLAKGNNKSARSLATASSSTLVDGPATTMSLAQIGSELFAVCLITCYSEGEESLRTTLDSISTTDYSDARKLMFIVCDGMITGSGEKRSTPDICVSLLEADERFGNPIPMSYVAVGSGSKAANRSMVYAGHYTVAGRATPTVIVVKCGTEEEAAREKKPGNRGKRDSQLILMNFFSRVTYNDRMSPLDFDLFRKIQTLMGITPDFFEVCLMVDADTKAFPESLRHLVNCMHNDQMIMGVCGETRIANKRQSWVTSIQVFEYFISHHLAKAFESVFGGVSCLPGCFSMFRLKSRRSTGEDWVPLIIKPEIVKEYSQSEVTTLHQKNLLLLGEDRFLTTILLRTFPNRKMMFLPQARCRTIVPDTFAILLSQRRRWINSTIHNLMELVLVRDLCGTFCFSMQFVVFMDLFGTVVLPIAIVLTYILIGSIAVHPPQTFDEAIPAMLLVGVLGLPGVLIMITTGKVVYIFWMLIYLLALPIWNFVLPLYAFWHFDDFSWGETRKVEGEAKGDGHGEDDGVNVAAQIPLRRWEDWERSRLRKIRREDRRRRDFERAHPQGFFAGENDLLAASGGFDARSQYDGSDTISVTSSEEDVWGGQVGGYNEDSVRYPPPPSALLPPDEALHHAQTIGGDDLEAMLEQGFEDRPTTPTYAPRYQLNDNNSSTQLVGMGGNGYAPLSRSRDQPEPALFSPTTPTPPEQRNWAGPPDASWGPLGPLDPARQF